MFELFFLLSVWTGSCSPVSSLTGKMISLLHSPALNSALYYCYYNKCASLSLVAPGKVSILEDAALEAFHAQLCRPVTKDDEDPKMKLTTHDIYKELRLRGYDYGKTFQGILESNNGGRLSVGVGVCRTIAKTILMLRYTLSHNSQHYI